MDSNKSMSDEFEDNLLRKNYVSFWKNWRQITGNARTYSTMIDGHVNHVEIAECFSENYSSVYKGTDSNSKLKDQFDRSFPSYQEKHGNVNLNTFLFTWYDMLDAVNSLKVGKATSTFLKAEHIFCGSPELTVYLHLLFNGLLSHSYMPQEFLCGTITPIIKDANGDMSASGNYRPITLGPILLMIFEHLLINKFGHYLECSNLQFGYKWSHSTSQAVFVLKEVQSATN